MIKKDQETNEESREEPKGKASEVINTLEWLITAFILAFVFRAFVMEAYRIPTGSMADTLMGAHFRISCRECGYSYEYGFIPQRYGLVQDSVPLHEEHAPATRCPSCGYVQWGGQESEVSNGDRILVLKCIYQFVEPKRWDVVVFKNPMDPKINYIKRMIGRPGETVEIIDGDIYINGEIARKPEKIQEELWMTVYDNDYQPVRPSERSFNGHTWQQPFTNREGSNWVNESDNRTIFRLNSPTGQINTMFYDTKKGNDFRTAYAYNLAYEYKNDRIEYEELPFSSDLMVRFYFETASRDGGIGIVLEKYGINYKANLSFDGQMKISKVSGGRETELTDKRISPVATNRPEFMRFANVDHQLIFQAGREKLVFDMGRKPDSAGSRKVEIEPDAEIIGSGKLTVSHLAVYRDIHYTGTKRFNGQEKGRACEGNPPLKLLKDQFFVLGDNSPNSEDGRWWNKKGLGNNGKEYDEGIVPRDYLVGKAIFVYWPGGFDLEIGSFKSPISFIPNVGRMRFVRGG